MRQPGNVGSPTRHERVERIAVLAQRALDEAVVGGIAHRGEEAAVEHDPARLRVELVLVSGARRHLDEDDDVGHRHSRAARSARRAARRSRPCRARCRRARSAAGRCAASGRRRCGRGRARTRARPRRCGRASSSASGSITCATATASWIGAPSQPYVSRVVARRRSRRGRRRTSRSCPRRAAAPGSAGVVTALWVTSSPTIVVSIPEWKTACAASGSAQMLNSAAGVMLPSAIAPPMSTIRSTFAPPVRSSSRATFVSGPVGISVTGRSLAAIVRAMKSTACSPSGGSLAPAAATGPSSPLSPWTWAATVSSRSSGRSAPAATGTSGRADEVEHPERVRGRLLERLVAVRRS